MRTADFLFPKDLQVSDVRFRRVLVIGSCLSRTYVLKMRERFPDVVYDYDLFNNASDLQSRTDEQLQQYDYQYIQIPLRSVLTDAVVRIADNDKSETPADWLELGMRNIDAMLEKATAYNRQTGLLTLVANFIVPQGRLAPSLSDFGADNDIVEVVRSLNKYLASEIGKLRNAYIADVDMIANSIGKKYFLDDSIVFSTHGALFYTDWSGHERYPSWTAPVKGRIEDIPNLGETYENKNDEFFDAVFRQMDAIYRSVMQIDMVKLVVFDLDNTLWRGQLVEHYQPGIKAPYSDGWPLGLWDAIHQLRRRGIIVTIASKNDEELVKKKWDDAVQPPFIKYSDFLSPKISWRPKAEGIQELLEEFSLTPKSVVFVDDNPVERDFVKAAFPDIRTIGSDPFVVRRILMWSPETQIARRSSESLRREDMLKAKIDRKAISAKLSREEFLQTLELKVCISIVENVSHKLFSRTFELVNKTNQFNTTGKRWALDEYNKYFSAGGIIFAFSVVDKFSDYGSVGAVFVREGQIDQFVMSCRTLGLDVELSIIDHIAKMLREKKVMDLSAVLVETESNNPCRTVFARAGFDKTECGNFILRAGRNTVSVSHISVTQEH
ncbi:HAD-IIIC family phosphatase [Pseudoduganella umbonata]|uniref:FkbH-like protein n=1 Tax=Pseudoduganella umbonata TaxID=864828 RepID=A0A4P8HSR1_9BURK|nr:HAD-IIIC family phosphatase [Pseudoduganella umbonata]MBB3225075.1 FkbH-like protein [Pseudoduganella umbonata]QCP11455.1 HAD-IIIC family phosphatase [Pseudoduganella umbonata]